MGWGAPRIHGELLKLGIDIGERSVSRFMPPKATGETRDRKAERYRKTANIMRAVVGASLLREDRDLRFRSPRSVGRRYREPIGSLGTMTNFVAPSIAPNWDSRASAARRAS